MRKNFCWATACRAHGASAPNAAAATNACRRVIVIIDGLSSSALRTRNALPEGQTTRANAIELSATCFQTRNRSLRPARHCKRPPSERARLHAVDVALQVLPDEIMFDEALVGVGQPLGHRSPHLLLRADV